MKASAAFDLLVSRT